MPNGRFLGRIPTPLEVVDAGLDSVAEVVQLPARVGSKVFMSGQQTAERVNQAIGRPKEYAEVPAPPDVILQGGLDAVTGLASGVADGIGGVFDALQQTGEGIKRQLDALIRR